MGTAGPFVATVKIKPTAIGGNRGILDSVRGGVTGWKLGFGPDSAAYTVRFDVFKDGTPAVKTAVYAFGVR